MLVKSYDLTGVALDWAVAKCANVAVTLDTSLKSFPLLVIKGEESTVDDFYTGYNSSLEGFAIARLKEYKISLMHVEEDDPYPIDDGPWSANISGQEYGYTGPTPEIAICRCVVTYKLGEDIEIPDELLKDK